MATNIVVPQLGESVVEARVARWLKKEGDAVTVGEPLVELETEKIDLEVGAEQAGVLAKIQRQEGEDVKIGDVLGVIGEATAAAATAASAPAAASAAAAPAATAAAAAPTAPATDGRQLATPTARRMAETHDIELAGVAGTGEAGRITKRDVASHVTTATAAPAPAS